MCNEFGFNNGKNILDNSVLMILFADKRKYNIKVIYEDRIVLKFTLI